MNPRGELERLDEGEDRNVVSEPGRVIFFVGVDPPHFPDLFRDGVCEVELVFPSVDFEVASGLVVDADGCREDEEVGEDCAPAVVKVVFGYGDVEREFPFGDLEAPSDFY